LGTKFIVERKNFEGSLWGSKGYQESIKGCGIREMDSF
jgi:hypothetical protein